MKRRIIVCGDIHGAAKALIQCLKRSNFDFENDVLIFLGDVCDGWHEVYECVEILLQVKNLINIRGNHDAWFLDYIKTGQHPVEWRMGGDGTRNSYLKASRGEVALFQTGWGTISYLNRGDIPDTHKEFFNNQIPYYIHNNICFVHGGFDRDYPIDTQSHETLMWDRELWKKAQCCKSDQKLNTVDYFSHIYIGHTQVYRQTTNPLALPLTEGGVTNMDTGAGWSGKLTFLDINNGAYWQSDWVQDLYPNEPGRGKFKEK